MITLFSVLSLFTAPSFAQTPTNAAKAQYQAIQLNDNQTEYDFNDKWYGLKENGTPLSFQTVEKMIANGSLIPGQIPGSFLNIGYSPNATWIVFPIVNNTTQEMWELNLGHLKTGRLSPLKDIILYNMTSKEYVLNARSLFEKNKNIEDNLTFRIPPRQTSFFILYVKPNLSTPTILSPKLQQLNSFNMGDAFVSWVIILLSFSGFVFFLKSAKDNASLSDGFLSLSFLAISTPTLLTENFIFFNQLDLEIIYPIAYTITSQGLMLAFLTIKRGRDELPMSFLGGITSASFIINLVGIVILKSMPVLASYLIFGPIALSFVIIMALVWGSGLSSQRQAYTHIANASFFLFMMIGSIILLSFNFISINTLTAMLPAVFLGCAMLVAIVSKMPSKNLSSVKTDVEDDVFEDNKIAKKEVSLIHEAKEKSEYFRLMQVIEQERKLMGDLQVKSAQQNEDMRKAKEAADEANRAKSAFLAVVSHEIRTPMTGIMGMLRLLQDTQLSKDQKEYANTIKDSGDAMLALLNDILDFEKIESGKMDLENINFDLKRLIRSVHTLMRGHAEAKNVALELELDPNVPNWVYGDPTRLRQVLLNLINNAIKFTNKGAVYLRVRDLTGEAGGQSQTTHQIYFAVQDSGIGIGTANQKKLFMPFAQADTSISRKYGGTGLGLAICKRLIEAMGGAISINSKEGEGSTFFFTISMSEGSEVLDEHTDTLYPQDNGAAQATKAISPLSILIVDDNGINQKVVAGFVEKLGSQSMTAGTGADTLELHAKYQFDAILLDIELPDMNGMEITRIIRDLALPQKSNIPIIALTGNTGDDDIKNYLNAGMNDFAGKPITFEKIAEILSKIDNHFYVHKKSAADIDFSEDNESKEDKNASDEPEENLNEISPLAAYSSRLSSGQVNSEPTRSSFDLGDLEEEDTFEVAVRKFEELEKINTNPSQNGFKDSLSQSGLDEEILNSLKSGLSVEQIQEILVSFYEKADELIADIGNAYLNGDAIGLNARAHELKGMAGNFGFSELSKMCGIIEKAGKDGQLDIAKDPIDHLGEKYAMARTYLNKWLSE